MPSTLTSRRREIARVQRVIERLHSPRLHMMLIVALTGAVGFLASFALLHAGLDSLWARYAAAVAIAYLAFLFLLWCWLRLRRDDLLDGLDTPGPGWPGGGEWQVPEKPWGPGGGQLGGGGASGALGEGADASAGSPGGGSGVSDATGALDLEELTAVLLAIVAVVGAAGAALWIVWTAPALLAELALDASVATGLYRRLRDVRGDHWLRTAIRRTGWPFVILALLLALAGAAMQVYAPDARSIGEVIQRFGL